MHVERKEQVRETVKNRREALSPEERAEKSDEIQARLPRLQPLQEAESVFLYVSIGNEVGTRQLLAELVGSEKQVAVPSIEGETMTAAVLQGLDELAPGPFDVPQPRQAEVLDPARIDIALVPGVAFDTAGNRIGRGAGYYDRFLGDVEAAAVGLAYEFQVVDRIDTDPWDVPVDYIVTEERTVTCRR